MRTILIGLAAAALAAPAAAGEPADATVATLLGTSGVTHTTKTATRYGMTYSDVTYQDREGALVTLRLGSVEQFEMWKQAAAGHTTPVAGLGVEAFQMTVVRSVCAKGASGAACATPDYLRKAPKISDAQLAALVKAAL